MISQEIRTVWPQHYLAEDVQEVKDYMNTSQTVKEMLQELEGRLAFHEKKANETRALIQGIRDIGKEENGHTKETLVVHGQEFQNLGIAESASIMIKRANRPLHVSEIAKGLDAGGYHFRSKNPENSIAPVLYQAADKKIYGIVKKPKNTYTIEEIESRAKN